MQKKVIKTDLGLDDYKQARKKILELDNEVRKLVGEFASVSKEVVRIRRQVNNYTYIANQTFSAAEKQLATDLKAIKDLGLDDSQLVKEFQALKKEEAQLNKIAENLVRQTSKIRG